MPDQEQRPEDLRIPLHVEEVSVSRREVEKANVQIALITGTREQLVDKELTHVRVEIERVPIGRTIEVVPSISHEGDTTIIPVVEEIAVVERRLVLKEEIHIRRVKSCGVPSWRRPSWANHSPEHPNPTRRCGPLGRDL